MDIPEGIKEELRKGIKCPVCNEGYIHLRMSNLYILNAPYAATLVPALYCNKCYKELQIEYKENPFKILRIRETD